MHCVWRTCLQTYGRQPCPLVSIAATIIAAAAVTAAVDGAALSAAAAGGVPSACYC